jgi:trans-aconitate methyltransferase
VIADRLVRSGLDDVLDIGCGPGQFAELLHAAGLRSYLGFDFSAEAIGQAEARVPSYRFETGDARTTDAFDGFAYRVVTCLEVLEHVEADLDVLRRIRTGTRFLGTVPSFPSAAHVRWFTDPAGVAARYGEVLDDLDVRELPLTETTSLFLMDGVIR